MAIFIESVLSQRVLFVCSLQPFGINQLKFKGKRDRFAFRRLPAMFFTVVRIIYIFAGFTAALAPPRAAHRMTPDAA
ncbi:MAG TPA: hypothetical protein VGL10_05640 [Gammaproteobacteria bacterium]